MIIPQKVLRAFPLGKILSIKQITDGLVHKTFHLKTDVGQFILQRLHPVLESQAIAQDFLAVTSFLHEQKFSAPQCVLSNSGRVLVSDGRHKWRMQTFIAGRTYERIQNLQMAREVGIMYGKFHRIMDGFSHRFQTPLVWFDSPKRYKEFLSAVKKNRNSQWMKPVQKEVEYITQEMPKLFLPKGLPTRVIHADPKVSNILFDASGSAKALIDLDLCQRRPLVLDLGDAFHWWSGLEEDHPKNRFRLSFFAAAWKGYESQVRGWITTRERELVPQAIGLISMELASRFLADYFHDFYFGWDEKRYSSRREHNLARARGYLSLYRDIQKKRPRIKKIISA